MSAEYWPWWLGALAFDALVVAFPLLVGRRLGVSGAWERVLHWKTEREAERADAVLDDMSAFEAALAAETAAAFGAADNEAPGAVATVAAPATPSPEGAPAEVQRRMPLTTQLVLIVSIFAGGLIAALVSGRFEWHTDMGDAFRSIVTGGPLMWVVLFGGGVLVGIGTRMAGGCSSGHGLSGCSRGEPVSLVATAVFFGTAVAVSFLVWKVI